MIDEPVVAPLTPEDVPAQRRLLVEWLRWAGPDYFTQMIMLGRQPAWIAPHVKGPDGAPLLGGDRVNVACAPTMEGERDG